MTTRRSFLAASTAAAAGAFISKGASAADVATTQLPAKWDAETDVLVQDPVLRVCPPLFQLPTLAADSGFFQLEARIHRAFQNFKIYVGVATTFVSGKCSFLLKAEGASTRLRASKLNNADIRSNKPAS